MSGTKRNAAILYMPDAFDPKKSLNGRRMVGQSFLKGFFDYADVDEYIAFPNTKGRLDNFISLRRAVAFQNQFEQFHPVRKIITSRGGNASTSVWTAIRSVVSPIIYQAPPSWRVCITCGPVHRPNGTRSFARLTPCIPPWNISSNALMIS